MIIEREEYTTRHDLTYPIQLSTLFLRRCMFDVMVFYFFFQTGTRTDAAGNCRVTKEIYWYTKIAYRCVLKRKFPQGSSSMMTKFKFAKKGKINKNQSLVRFFGQFWQLQFWITSRSGHDDHHHSLKRSLLRTQDFQLKSVCQFFRTEKQLGVIIKFSELGRINQIGFGWIWIFRFFHVTEESGRKWSPTRAVDIWGRRGRGATGHMSGDQEFFSCSLF